MENKRKNNGRNRGKFLAKPPVIDLNSIKKDELVEDIFNKKPVKLNASYKRAPVKITKLEKVALPVLVIAAFAVGWSLAFNLFFYKTKIDLKEEVKLSAVYFLQAVNKSISYLGGDLEVLSTGPSFNFTAGIGFLGGKIADVAERASLETVSLIENFK